MGKLKLAAIYNQPQNIPTQRDFELLFKEDVPTLVAGVWNTKHTAWSNSYTDTSGKAIMDLIEKYNLEVDGTTTPTHYSERVGPLSTSIIDFAIFHELNLYYEMFMVGALSSDHEPMIIELHALHTSRLPDPETVNWDYFTEIISRTELPTTTDLKNRGDLEGAIEVLIQSI